MQPLLADTGEWDRVDLRATATKIGRRQTESWESSTVATVVVGRRLGVAKVTTSGFDRQEPC